MFITNDQNLKFQVNKNKLSFSFLDLDFRSNRYDDLLSVMPLLNKELIKFTKVIQASKRDNNSIYIFANSGFQQWFNLEE